jgi:hypothetical protein
MMDIPKEKVLELLRSRGDEDKFDQAERDLPDDLDPDRDLELFSRLGVEPSELLGKLDDQ